MDSTGSSGNYALKSTYSITDREKFQYMVQMNQGIFGNAEEFAKKIGAGSGQNKKQKGIKANKELKSGRSTVHNWLHGKGRINSTKLKQNICQVFNLRFDVWKESFPTLESFIIHYNECKIDNAQEEGSWVKCESVLFEDIIKMTKKEELYLKNIYDQQSCINIPTNIEHYSASFMLALVLVLKDNYQIEDALRVIEILLRSNTLFKAKNYNRIQHLKAILLSSDKIQDWDKALDILNILYFSAKYHLDDPEIVTLIASNYKRKALFNKNGQLNPPDRQYVDMYFLGKALASYRESYKLKKKDKYYDAINIAYLLGILNALEEQNDEEQDFKAEVKALYQELYDNGWRVNEDNWWEVTTDVEFLVLMGKEKKALSKFEEYLTWNEKTIKRFDMETTIRQIKLYVHFTDDAHAKAFLNTIEENWEAIQKYRLR